MISFLAHLLFVASLSTSIPNTLSFQESLSVSNRATGHANPALSFNLQKDYSSRLDHDNVLFEVQDRYDGSTPTPTLRARPTVVYRPRSHEAYHRARWRAMVHGEEEKVDWDELEILGPDIEDRHTLQQLARMSGNAYALPGKKNWYDIDGAWNTSFPFGWEDPTNGFRGHVFVSSDNSTVILSIKGTTLQGPTSKKDKFNDNLLFSCCCARVDITWIFATVCDCYANHWRCDNTCLSEALIQDSLFYSVGVKLFHNLTSLYPHANIWLTGHSLGGALAALLGTTFGAPAVTFESPGERLAAERLHLPMPLLSPITHVYHNADPIPQGACTGSRSPCAQGGYALETQCHLGKLIVYDTVREYGWKVDVRKHVIREIIMTILEDDREWEEGRNVPLAREQVGCVDCYKWEFGEFKEQVALEPSQMYP